MANPSSVDYWSVVLALECPKITESKSSRSASKQRARVDRSTKPKIRYSEISPFVVTIPIGEDIVENIRVFLEDHKHVMPSCDDSYVKGHILSAVGDVSSPKIEKQGSSTISEGIHAIVSLSGCYIIRNDGPVVLESLTLSFDEHCNHIVTGSVVGSLIASCAVQVILGCVKVDQGEDQHHS